MRCAPDFCRLLGVEPPFTIGGQIWPGCGARPFSSCSSCGFGFLDAIRPWFWLSALGEGLLLGGLLAVRADAQTGVLDAAPELNVEPVGLLYLGPLIRQACA